MTKPNTATLSFAAGAVEGKPPTAFRIWEIGPVETMKGTFQFTEASAEAIMAEQAERNVLIPIDVEHGSFNTAAPLAARAAVGWASLEMRGAELWAVGVELNDEMRAELAKDVPGFKYFSPAFETDDEGTITSLINIAITNTPATLDAPQLASRRIAASARPDVSARKARRAELIAAASWLPADVAAELATMRLEDVEGALVVLAAERNLTAPRAPEKPAPAASVKRKALNPGVYDRTSMREDLDRRMGLAADVPASMMSLTKRQTAVLNSMSRSDLARFRASKDPTERRALYELAEERLKGARSLSRDEVRQKIEELNARMGDGK